MLPLISKFDFVKHHLHLFQIKNYPSITEIHVRSASLKSTFSFLSPIPCLFFPPHVGNHGEQVLQQTKHN